jgi:hypothetical protein
MAQHPEHRYYDVLEQYFTKSIENAETYLFDQDLFDQTLWGLEDRYGVPFEVTPVVLTLFLLERKCWSHKNVCILVRLFVRLSGICT